MPSFRDQPDRLLADLLAMMHRAPFSVADPAGLAPDLQIHPIEPEPQQRELRHAQQVPEASSERYADPYDVAPAAYVNLFHEGRLTQLNPSDIAEIAQARAALVAQQRFLQAVIDGIGDPIMVIGTDYQVLLMNRAGRQAAGLSAAGLCGLPCYHAIHGREVPCSSPEHPCPVPQVLADGRPVKVVHRNLWADGEIHWLEVIGAPLRGPTGEVLGVIESSRDITGHLDLSDRLKKRELQLEHLTEHDPLTGLPNRLLFADRLRQTMRHAYRERHKVALLFLDLDRFKSINDSLGHPTGDLVLQQAARRIRGLVRETDTVARVGGDEFILVLGGLRQGRDAGMIAHKLVAAFEEPFEVAGRLLYVTATIGLSLYPDDGTELEDLVRNADSAMSSAKAQGGGTFRFYTEDMTTQALARVALETDLRQALARAEFVLYYQSQIELATGRLVGCEALIRWQHPAFGLVAPDRFIPVAESTGLIVPISDWVIRTAAAQIKIWQDRGLLTDAAVWINLSGRDTQNPNLAATIAGICSEVGIRPGGLAVELTETWIMADPDVAAENIRRLDALGIAVGIDDFGTGYSSLASLNRLAVREIKIDRSFVAGLPADRGGCAIARAMIALGLMLGLRVVAEGVETEIQANFLKAEGCGIGQGYLFSQPLPAAEFEAYARGLTPGRSEMVSGDTTVGAGGSILSGAGTVPVPGAPPAAPAPPPIDGRVIRNLREAIGELTAVIEVALADVERRVADLRLGVETGDGERIRNAAHTLAGSVANLGGRELVRLARALESLGKSGELAAAPGLLAALEAETARFLAALAELLAAEAGVGAVAADAP